MISECDIGWFQFYVENNQEVLDFIFIVFKVVEDERVFFLVMVGFDVFILIYIVELVEIFDQEVVDEFFGEYELKYVYFDLERLIIQGIFVFLVYYMEVRYIVWEVNENVKKVIDEVFVEFEKKFGRKYQKVEEYRIEDVEIIFVIMGLFVGIFKEYVDYFREKGFKVGVVKFIVYRLFLIEEVREFVKKVKVFVFFEKNVIFSVGGVFFQDFSRVFVNFDERLKIVDFIFGFGGRDVIFKDFDEVLVIVQKVFNGEEFDEVNWIGLRKEIL